MLRNYKGRFYFLTMGVIDALLIYVSYLFTVYLFNLFATQSLLESLDKMVVAISICSIASFFLFDCYTFFNRKNFNKVLLNLFLALLIINLPLLFIIGFKIIIVAFITQVFCVGFFRYIIWRMTQRSFGQKKVLVITDETEERTRIINKVLRHTPGWFVLSGILSSKTYHEELKDFDSVMICPSIQERCKKEIIHFCTAAEKEVLLIPDYYDLLVTTSDIQQIDDMMVYSIQPAKRLKSNDWLKRVWDVIGSAILIVISSPFLLLFFILIPLTSKGPALYAQERIGLNGKPYFIYKFRSMITNAESQTGPTLATESDPRITTIGKWIRATRIDELPQLFNVIKGDMSLVGPRPERDYFIQQFNKDIPYYNQRLAVRPGITGLAQVLANYTTSVEDKLHYDLMYIRDHSIFLDVKILFQTIRVVLQRDQAQGVPLHTFMSSKDLVIHTLKVNRQHKAH